MSERTLEPSDDLKARLGPQNLALRNDTLEAVRLNYAGWRTGSLPLEAVCAEAGEALNQYALTTLDTLLSSTDATRQAQPATSLPEDYREAVGSFAREIRDVFADARGRHAVAQVLQTVVVRAETRLRDLRDRR